MYNSRNVTRDIADDTHAFESLSDNESIKLTHKALADISNFEQGESPRII